MIRDILDKRILLLDSAMGTALIASGALPAGEGSERANLAFPTLVEEIHRRNINAGCDIITTNTFGAHIGVSLRKDGDPALAEEALRAGIRIARKAADRNSDGTATDGNPDGIATDRDSDGTVADRNPGGKAAGRKVYVALDIGPIGDIIGLTSSLTHDDATEVFARMAIAGADEGADLVFIETMSDLAEAVDAIAASKAQTNLPVFCSMTFGANGRTFMGVSVEAFVAAAAKAGADAVGCNCSLGPDEMLPIAKALVSAAGNLPVIVQPNAGQPLISEDEVYYDMTPEVFVDGVSSMIAAGARIAGGCCGTTPEMIALLKEKIE